MIKTGIVGVGEIPCQEHRIKMFEKLFEKDCLSIEHIDGVDNNEIHQVMEYPVQIPIKICELQPKICELQLLPRKSGRGRSVMCEEHYQKQIYKRRKRNKNKKTHRG